MLLTYNDHDLDVAAQTVWGEARGEGAEGQRAVAWVIRNRAMRPAWWGRDVAGVCQKAFQFSCWNEGDPNFYKVLLVNEKSNPEYATIRALVEEVFESDGPDPTGGASHYCVKGLRPAWRKDHEPVAVIGNHEFFKLGPSA